MDANKHLTYEFREGVYEFLKYVIGKEKFVEQGEMLRCPCVKCRCKVFKYVDQVGLDLYEEGFMPNYYWWTIHGEELSQFAQVDVQSTNYRTCEQRDELDPFHQMIMDHVGPSNAYCMQQDGVIGLEYMNEDPDPETQKFFYMLAAAQTPLWEGCENHSELSTSLEALSLKSDYNMSEGCFNRMVQLMGEIMPKDHRMINNFF